jgi:hypothetical protein
VTSVKTFWVDVPLRSLVDLAGNLFDVSTKDRLFALERDDTALKYIKAEDNLFVTRHNSIVLILMWPGHSRNCQVWSGSDFAKGGSRPKIVTTCQGFTKCLVLNGEVRYFLPHIGKLNKR